MTKNSTKIYLQSFTSKSDSNDIFVTIETYIILFLYNYLNQPKELEIYLIQHSNDDDQLSTGILINVQSFPRFIRLCQKEYEKLHKYAALCKFPVALTNDSIVIAGLCGVCRCLIKNQNDLQFQELLGFKAACLLAPSESSIWTKFCEIDIIECVKTILNLKTITVNDECELPEELCNFEMHLSQPIRMHNIYKLARELANKEYKVQQQQQKLSDDLKKLSVNDVTDKCLDEMDSDGVSIVKEKVKKVPRIKKSKKPKNPIQIDCRTPINDLNLDHTFAEGQQITIADIILFACYTIIFDRISLTNDTNLLLTIKWMKAITSTDSIKINDCLQFYKQLSNLNATSSIKMIKRNELPAIKCKEFSLYKSDPTRYKPKNRLFTKQNDIDDALTKINLNLTISNSSSKTTNNCDMDAFDWSSIPYDALPEGGQLPLKRLNRKKDQLQSLAQEIIRIAKPNDRIVDFCCGGGHLGILLAYLLPNCHIILLENKEESLQRAKQRVDAMHMKNVTFFQCNLDYFCGKFNIGTSLHACGVASDIVLWHCIRQQANFVCCPCCYGGIHQMPHISYPRSNSFNMANITSTDYMFIAHCADQAHDIDKGPCNIVKSEQGQYCMDIIDTDRKMYAEECGYFVTLKRLTPENCTPKNRLLIGIK